MAAPCAGLCVLDLSRGPAGGIATMILADFGAEVIKVEPPGGDPFRTLAAAPMWLRGKHSIVLDLTSAADTASLHALARSADVVVTSFRPGTAERLGADEATLRARNPRLVYCAITGFGPTGPYSRVKGYEGVVVAKSGRMMTFAGQVPRPGPVYQAVQLGTHAASQAAVQGILAALLVRDQTGRGQRVETSLLQGMLPYDMAGLVTQQLLRNLPEQFPTDPLANYNRQPTLQYQPVITADGRWLQLGNLVEHLFHAFIAAAGLSDIYADPRFTTAPYLPDDAKEALRLVILERMQQRTADEWMETFIADGNVAAEPYACTQDALSHPQLVAGGDVIDVHHPRLGRMKQIGPVAALTATPATISNTHPEIGEHQHRLTELLNRGSVPAAHAPRPTPHAPRHPLDGVTVLEFATIIAAPLGCALLADLGARVIKVESPEGDQLRGLGGGISAAKTTAGKESICLNLKTVEGQAIVRRLVERADVLVHNYRPGVPERLSIGYEQVREYNPDIVYVAAMGYGSHGPMAHRPSAHPIPGAAVGGALWQAGRDMPPSTVGSLEEAREFARRLMRANETNPDPSTSMVIATAALLGLFARRRLGIGQYIDVNMFRANAYANFDDFLAYDGKPPRPLVDPELHGLTALYRLYPAAEGWVFLACLSDGEWQALLDALGCPELAMDPRFATAEARATHDAALAVELGQRFATRAAAEWESLLTSVDVACVRVCEELPGVFWDTDAHARANGFVRAAEHPRWGALQRHGPVVSFSETPGRYATGVLAGQHTIQLLREIGYDDEQIGALRAAGVIATETV